MIEEEQLIGLGEFAKLIGCNRAYLGSLCLYAQGKTDVTETSPRMFKGVALPLPVSGSFLTKRKLWDLKDALEFKNRLVLKDF